MFFFRKKKEKTWRRWICVTCDFIYDEEQGYPEEGIPPGTKWEDVPDDWLCPDCLIGKYDFELMDD